MQVLEPQRHERLTAALAQALWEELEMDRSDAMEIAGYVVGAFQGDDELDDDELDPDLRSIFYTLENQRLLSFRREEYRNEEGFIRRAFYWRIRWEEIDTTTDGPQGSDQRDEGSVYEALPRDAWSRA